jgi:steroid delta-isomerase-like uncharacterized protein
MTRNKDLVRRFVSEVLNSRSDEVAARAIDELVAEDYVVHDPDASSDIRGREALKRYVADFKHSFPDFHVNIEDIIAEGDRVAARYTTRGTHEGEYLGIPPTGKTITVSEMAIERIVDGRFVETWLNCDTLGVMRQLGAISEPTGGTTSTVTD